LPRNSSQTFKCQPLDDLTRQLLYAPVKSKLADQVQRAERLHDEIEPDVVYPLDYLMYRITGIPAASPSETFLVGDAVGPDLRLMIDQISRGAGMVVDPEHPCESIRQLAQRFDVSTKTIARWRKAGLRWRWMSSKPGARAEIRIPADAIDRFIQTHGKRIERATRFTKIDPHVRQRIVERARRITSVKQVTLNQMATHLARRIGRAVESVRRILEENERLHPDQLIFPHHSGPLDGQTRQSIADAYESGQSIDQLAQQFKRSRSTIHRVIHERRAAALRKIPIQFVKSPLFDRPDADQVILRPYEADQAAGSTRKKAPSVDVVPQPLRQLFECDTFDAEMERMLLVRLNYLKVKICRLRDQLDPYEPRVADMDQIDQLLVQIDQLRGQLLRANLPVVLNVAKQHLTDVHDKARFRSLLLLLLEQGTEVLIESIDQFDPGRKQAFHSYVIWNVARCFARLISVHNESGKAVRRENPESVLERLSDLARDHRVTLGG